MKNCKKVRLNTICDVYDGTHETPKYKEQGIKFVSVENIENISDTSKYISNEDYEKYKIKPQKNDVMMTRIGSVGVCALIESDEKLAYYVSLALLRPNQNFLISKYLKYIIESCCGIRELRKRTLLNAIPMKINTGDIGKITIPLPSLEIQKKIAGILSTQDKFIELKQKLIDRKKQQKKWLMQNLLTGKIRLKGFECEWEKVRLGDICEISTGNKNTQDKIDNGKYPFFVRSQIVEHSDSYYYDCEAVLTAGDGVGVGKVFHYINGKFDCHQRVYIINNFSDLSCGKYIFYYFKMFFYNRVKKMSAKNSVDSIRYNIIADMMINLPIIEEQTAIAEILSAQDREIELLEKQLEQEKLKKKALMQFLFKEE